MVGELHTAAPAGPKRSTPVLFLPRRSGRAGIVYDFQILFPVFASSATTLPRNVQQAYCGSPPGTSSTEETGTYRRSWYSFGAPVTRAKPWSSTLTFQTWD